MSAPTPAAGDDTPVAGFYPDPSIPGYVRYWNGASWVPGTSRPAPRAETAPAPADPAPTRVVEETGPVFLDEEPSDQPSRPEPATAWAADTARQSGFGGERDHRVNWGGGGREPLGAEPRGAEPDPRAAAETRLPAQAAAAPAEQTAAPDADPAAGAVPGARPAGGGERPAATESTLTIRALRARIAETGTPGARGVPEGLAVGSVTPGAAPAERPQPPQPRSAQPRAAAPAPAPVAEGPGGGAASWAQQVHRLARTGEAEPQPVTPWKPPADDPFLRMARAQAAARPAGLGRRVAARLIDTLVLGGLVGAVAVPVVSRAVAHVDAKIEAARHSGQTVTVWLIDSTTGVHLAIVLAALLILGTLYEALPVARWGRTLGKKLCGLKVVDIESHEPPPFGAALRRWLVYGGLGLIAVGAVNVLWALIDRPWRQCWHDKAAHTFVTAA
ncbi:RDD family protein [Streptomyces sp. CAU 1734]|uniref:RDD family protein n=1 Tax=Streptomyces sp. CAU 1734 TaxID=3140360 RepID=UPI0032612268